MSEKETTKNVNYAYVGFVFGVSVMTIVALYDQNQTLRTELACANSRSDHNFAYWKVLTDFVTNNGLAKEALENYNKVFAKE